MVGQLVTWGDELGVAEEAPFVVSMGLDGEDGREDEREFLGAHGLHFKRAVDGEDVKVRAALPRRDLRLLCQFHIVDATPCDRQVLRRLMNPIVVVPLPSSLC